LRRQFVTRQGGSDDAYLEGMLGTANAVLGQIDRKGGNGQFRDRSNVPAITVWGNSTRIKRYGNSAYYIYKYDCHKRKH